MRKGVREMVTVGIRLFLHKLLSGQRSSQDNPKSQPMTRKWELRDALLKCSTLTEAEVDEYMEYRASAVYETVPLDYELDHPDEAVSCLYSDGLAQVKVRELHTAQISPETLAKVRRVLPLLYHP